MSIVNKFKLFIAGGERTQDAQELTDQMAKVDALCKNTKEVIERIRCNAQPNKTHRYTDTMYPPDDDSNERVQYAIQLRNLASSTSDTGVSSFLKNLADVQETVYKQYQDKFFKQVQVFCIKELKKFTDVTYVELKNAYSELKRKRDAYDLARHKLKSCKPEDVEQRGETAKTAQREFEQQANTMFELLQKLPDHEMALAKAIFTYTRAESDYTTGMNDQLKKIKLPGKTKTSVKE